MSYRMEKSKENAHCWNSEDVVNGLYYSDYSSADDRENRIPENRMPSSGLVEHRIPSSGLVIPSGLPATTGMIPPATTKRFDDFVSSVSNRRCARGLKRLEAQEAEERYVGELERENDQLQNLIREVLPNVCRDIQTLGKDMDERIVKLEAGVLEKLTKSHATAAEQNQKKIDAALNKFDENLAKRVMDIVLSKTGPILQHISDMMQKASSDCLIRAEKHLKESDAFSIKPLIQDLRTLHSTTDSLRTENTMLGLRLQQTSDQVSRLSGEVGIEASSPSQGGRNKSTSHETGVSTVTTSFQFRKSADKSSDRSALPVVAEETNSFFDAEPKGPLKDNTSPNSKVSPSSRSMAKRPYSPDRRPPSELTAALQSTNLQKVSEKSMSKRVAYLEEHLTALEDECATLKAQAMESAENHRDVSDDLSKLTSDLLMTSHELKRYQNLLIGAKNIGPDRKKDDVNTPLERSAGAEKSCLMVDISGMNGVSAIGGSSPCHVDIPSSARSSKERSNANSPGSCRTGMERGGVSVGTERPGVLSELVGAGKSRKATKDGNGMKEGLIWRIASEVFNENFYERKVKYLDKEYVRYNSPFVMEDFRKMQSSFYESLNYFKTVKDEITRINEELEDIRKTVDLAEAKNACKFEQITEGSESNLRSSFGHFKSELDRGLLGTSTDLRKFVEEKIAQYTRLQRGNLLTLNQASSTLMGELRQLKLLVQGPAEHSWTISVVEVKAVRDMLKVSSTIGQGLNTSSSRKEKTLTSKGFTIGMSRDCKLVLYPGGCVSSSPGFAAIALLRPTLPNYSGNKIVQASKKKNPFDLDEDERPNSARSTSSTTPSSGGNFQNVEFSLSATDISKHTSSKCDFRAWDAENEAAVIDNFVPQHVLNSIINANTDMVIGVKIV